MKIICSQSELSKAVNIVSKAVPTRTTMTILECILIDASKNVIRLVANDTEIGIETQIDGTIEEPGIVALDAKVFSEIVRKLPDNMVIINTDSDFKTLIKCEKANFNIIGKPGDDFSYLPELPKDDAIVISQFSLREIIHQTIFCTSDTESNKIMTGELFRVDGGKLKVVALDGHRIAIREIELKEEYASRDVIVPKKTLNEVSKVIGGGLDDDVNIYITENHITFVFDRTTVVSRLIDGEYFRVEQMLSSVYDTRIKISKSELLGCLDRSTLLVKEGDKKPIIMNITDEGMHLVMNSFIGSLNEEIDISKEGADILIGFNPKFFIDALRVIEDDEITIYFVNSKAPAFIKNDNESYIYMILPVNVKTE